MNFRLILKIAAVIFVSVLVLIPISAVESLVSERQTLRDQVVADMAKSAGYAQTVAGPFLVVPYDKVVRTWTENAISKEQRLVESVVRGNIVLLPKKLDVTGQLDIEERARGIYRARVFALGGKLSGTFTTPPSYGVREALADYTFGTPYLALGLSDVRGIGSGLSLRIDGKESPFSPSVAPPGASSASALSSVLVGGVHAPLERPSDVTGPRTFDFAIELPLHGTGDFRVVPVGQETHVALRSNWPHPSFVGEFLPRSRSIGPEGFNAEWTTSFFATNLESLAERCAAGASEGACTELGARNFGVDFVDPVDHYLKSERATKYAFLFVALTFAAFFLVEVLRQKAVHAVQYGLVGLALAVFFLLLLSLSEHLGFAAAYAISSAVSVLLIGYYVVPIVGSFRGALGFAGGLGGLYGTLYAILDSEDYALLTGSLVVFAVLGLAMTLTRRIDWSAFGRGGGAESAPKPLGGEAASAG